MKNSYKLVASSTIKNNITIQAGFSSLDEVDLYTLNFKKTEMQILTDLCKQGIITSEHNHLKISDCDGKTFDLINGNDLLSELVKNVVNEIIVNQDAKILSILLSLKVDDIDKFSQFLNENQRFKKNFSNLLMKYIDLSKIDMVEADENLELMITKKSICKSLKEYPLLRNFVQMKKDYNAYKYKSKKTFVPKFEPPQMISVEAYMRKFVPTIETKTSEYNREYDEFLEPDEYEKMIDPDEAVYTKH